MPPRLAATCRALLGLNFSAHDIFTNSEQAETAGESNRRSTGASQLHPAPRRSEIDVAPPPALRRLRGLFARLRLSLLAAAAEFSHAAAGPTGGSRVVDRMGFAHQEHRTQPRHDDLALVLLAEPLPMAQLPRPCVAGVALDYGE